MQCNWKMIAGLVGLALIAWGFLSYIQMPVVEYSMTTRQPTGCVVEPNDDGVNRIPASDPRCKAIIKGRHNAEWVR
mgnify:CR=1 FL=1